MPVLQAIADHVLLAQQELFMAIAFIFLAMWFVLKLATDRLRQQPPPGQRPPQQPPARPELRQEMRPEVRPAQQRPGQQRPGQVRDPREEVAEFLRRAQQRREGERAAPPVKPKRQQAPPERKRPVREPQRRESQPSRGVTKPPPLVQPTMVESPAPGGERRRGLAAELAERRSEVAFDDPYARTAIAPEASVSDSMVTGTAHTSAESMAVVPTSASDIAQTLTDPDRLREAIVLHQILQPPLGRW